MNKKIDLILENQKVILESLKESTDGWGIYKGSLPEIEDAIEKTKDVLYTTNEGGEDNGKY